MSSIKKIIIAEDHTIVRQGLRSLLESEKEYRIVAEAEDGLEAVQRVRGEEGERGVGS